MNARPAGDAAPVRNAAHAIRAVTAAKAVPPIKAEPASRPAPVARATPPVKSVPAIAAAPEISPPPTPTAEPAVIPAPAIDSGPASYPVEAQGPYTLDTGDVVRVTVYGEPELSREYHVDDTGAISLPLVGSIPVRGETTRKVADAVTAALADGYLRDPSVAVEIDEYRPFFIQGAVRHAGQFPYVYGMTARAAISTAGGLSDTADPTRAIIYRRQGNQMVRSAIALDSPIHPGDTVVVPDQSL